MTKNLKIALTYFLAAVAVSALLFLCLFSLSTLITASADSAVNVPDKIIVAYGSSVSRTKENLLNDPLLGNLYTNRQELTVKSITQKQGEADVEVENAVSVGEYSVTVEAKEGSTVSLSKTTFKLAVDNKIALSGIVINRQYTGSAWDVKSFAQWRTDTYTPSDLNYTYLRVVEVGSITDADGNVVYKKEYVENPNYGHPDAEDSNVEYIFTETGNGAIDSGTYKVKVILQPNNPARGEYVLSEDFDEFTLVIEPQSVVVENTDNVHWILNLNGNATAELRDETIYKYSYTVQVGEGDETTTENRYYYARSPLEFSPDSSWSNWTRVYDDETRSWLASAVRYRGKVNHTIGIVSPEVDGKALYSAVVTGNTASETGRYVATAILTANQNYRFENTQDLSEAQNMLSRGMTVIISADGRTATITKVWYLVNFDNSLMSIDSLDKTEGVNASDKPAIDYIFEGWTFGDDVSRNFPILAHGDERLSSDFYAQPNGYSVKVNGLETASNDILTFSLYRTENGTRTEICKDITRDHWDYYINKFVPAGNYEIIFNAKTITLGAHAHWWNGEQHDTDSSNEIEYQGFSHAYNFTVSEGNLVITNEDLFNSFNQPSELKDNFVSAVNVESINGDYANFFILPNNTAAEYSYPVSWNDVSNSGTYWSQHSEYYQQSPIMLYNLARMFNNRYLDVNDGYWNSVIGTVGKYQVFYSVEMKNYVSNPLIASDDRYQHYFEIILYREIDRPTFLPSTYTGEGQTPILADGENNGYFTVERQEFVDARTHQVSVTIKPEYQNYIGWRGYGIDTYSIDVDFVIGKVENSIEFLKIVSWQWGSYSESVNKPIAGARYGDSSVLNFTYYRIVGGNRQLYSGNIANADVGDYVVVCSVAETGNYTGDSAEARFAVSAAQNYWDKTPNIVRWVYGEYDQDINAASAMPHFWHPENGDSIRFVYYRVNEATGAIIPNTVVNEENFFNKMKDESGRIPVGTYAVQAILTVNTDNYTPMTSDPLTFKVIQAQNYWKETPNIKRWIYGEDPYAPQGEAAFGTPVFVIREKESGKVVYDSRNGVNDLKECKSGLYTLRATVQGTNDYTDMEVSEQEFRIFPADKNTWKVIPNIQGWAEGRTPNRPTGEAYIGHSVEFTYSALDGTLLDGAPSVKGDYILIATAKADGYEDLVGKVYFSVTGDASQELTDKNGNKINVSVSGVADKINVAAAELDSESETYKRSKQLLESAGYTLGAAYDLSLTDESNKVIQPNGSVSVTITLTADLLDKAGLQVVYIAGNGSVEYLGGTVQNNSIRFQTTHFSNYYLVYNNAPASNVNAGMIVAIVALVALMIILIAVAVIILKKSGKNANS